MLTKVKYLILRILYYFELHKATGFYEYNP